MKQFAVCSDGWKLVMHAPGKESAHEVLLTHPLFEEWRLEVFPELEGRGLSKELFDLVRSREDYGAIHKQMRKLMKAERYSLFYLPDDPNEERDLAADEPEVLARMKALFTAEEARRERARSNARLPTTPAQLSKEAKANLADLGYADTGEDEE